MLDDLRYLVLKPVFWSYILLGVNTQLIEPTFLLLDRLLKNVFTLHQICSIVSEFSSQIFFERLPNGAHNIILVDSGRKVGSHSHLKRHCFFRNRETFLLAQDNFKSFFKRVFIPTIELEFLRDDILNQSDQLIKIDPRPFSRIHHHCPFQTKAKSPATFSKRNRVVVHIRDECEYAFGEVCLDMLLSHAFVHELAEQLLWLVERNVVLLVLAVG